MGLKATPEPLLAAAKVELPRILKRLIACQNRLYRETGTYPEVLSCLGRLRPSFLPVFLVPGAE
jgi:hypothetical protein